MKKKHHTPEQIVHMLRQAEAKLAAGTNSRKSPGSLVSARLPSIAGGIATVVCRRTDFMKRLRELEKENARLKKIVADQAVDISILKEVSRKNF